MRSASMLDRPPFAEAPQAHDLLVLWQHPVSREIVPIGRFGRSDGQYTFVYTRAAAAVEGFRPLPGLSVGRRNVSDRMPAVFDQRVMEPDRPDYADYLASIGLDPAAATPWEQIVQSGGARAGDTLQFMQLPRVVNGRAWARFFANGVSHVGGSDFTVDGRSLHVSAEDQESALRSLTVGDSVLIESDDDNPVDASACLITTEGVPVGWVPRVLSSGVRRLLESGPLPAVVARIGEPGGPSHLRLVVDLDAVAPNDFDFDVEGPLGSPHRSVDKRVGNPRHLKVNSRPASTRRLARKA